MSYFFVFFNLFSLSLSEFKSDDVMALKVSDLLTTFEVIEGTNVDVFYLTLT